MKTKVILSFNFTRTHCDYLLKNIEGQGKNGADPTKTIVFAKKQWTLIRSMSMDPLWNG